MTAGIGITDMLVSGPCGVSPVGGGGGPAPEIVTFPCLPTVFLAMVVWLRSHSISISGVTMEYELPPPPDQAPL